MFANSLLQEEEVIAGKARPRTAPAPVGAHVLLDECPWLRSAALSRSQSHDTSKSSMGSSQALHKHELCRLGQSALHSGEACTLSSTRAPIRCHERNR